MDSVVSDSVASDSVVSDPPTGLRFAKGHGTGNDFVILPDPDDRLTLTPELVRAVCDRRFGIGGDGVLRVVKDGADWFMDYWNADGSIAEMCGNGVRVYARYLVDSGLAAPTRIPIRTRAGAVVAVVERGDIAVDMGMPKLYGESTATVSGLPYPGTAVDCGNPHLVCPVSDLSTLDLSVAPGFDTGFFPSGVNMEFVVPRDALPGADLHVAMRVFERGSGETFSCGSGAVAVAAVATRDADLDRATVAVDVPGGRLTATFDGDTCWLAGPAVIVAWGRCRLD